MVLVLTNASLLASALVLFCLEYFYFPNPPAREADVANAADWATESACLSLSVLSVSRSLFMTLLRFVLFLCLVACSVHALKHPFSGCVTLRVHCSYVHCCVLCPCLVHPCGCVACAILGRATVHTGGYRVPHPTGKCVMLCATLWMVCV